MATYTITLTDDQDAAMQQKAAGVDMSTFVQKVMDGIADQAIYEFLVPTKDEVIELRKQLAEIQAKVAPVMEPMTIGVVSSNG